MNWKTLKTPVKALVIAAVIVIAVFSALPVQQKIHLGLDLQGGSRLLLQLYPTAEVPQITSQIQEQTLEVIDRRINGLGVSEPSISKVGSDRILVELPQVRDPEQAERVLKEVAVLEYKIVPSDVSQKAETDLQLLKDPSIPPKERAAAEAYVAGGAYAASGPVVYSGKDLKGAQQGYDQAGNPDILFQTKDPEKFGKLTQANLGKLLGIFLDHRYVSAPVIQGAIFGNGQITGSFTQEDAITLANELNAGALPVSVKVIEKETIGPTLGKIDLILSLRAAILGLGLVLIFMIVAYRLPGFLADIALAVYVLVMLAILSISHASLTLPGIAGFVLSIGMAVDANVLIFERIKEELWNGKSLRAAVRVGFQRAFTAVFDSHFTTIVGAGVLFMLGTGTVKGFAFTLFWGTVVSLVTAVFVTRFFVDVLVDNDLATAPALYGVKREEIGNLLESGRGNLAMFFRRLNWNIVGWFRIVSTISYLVIALGIAAMIYHGFQGGQGFQPSHMLRLGLSFTGGTDIDVKFTKPVTIQAVEQALSPLNLTDQQITTVGTKGDEVLIDTQTPFANDSTVLWNDHHTGALDKVAPVNTSASSITSVGPSLGAEYLRNALLALVIALSIQFLYIAFRFGWNYIFGLVTVIALVRDAAMMIGIYALADKRADDAFLAAVLTVIGYSVMDTIVILDRIRENTKLMAGKAYDFIVNESIKQTMTRSVNTLATVVITLVALLALGGASLKNFAFALLVGICSGGYHSIFYSAPLVLTFRKQQIEHAARKRAAGRASEQVPSGSRATGAISQSRGAAREEIIAARRERRAKQKASRATTGPQPARYRRRRAETGATTATAIAEDVDPLDAENAGLHDAALEQGHEEIHLNLDGYEPEAEQDEQNGDDAQHNQA